MSNGLVTDDTGLYANLTDSYCADSDILANDIEPIDR